MLGPNSRNHHQGIALLFRVRLEVPDSNQHPLLDEAHDVLVVLDLDATVVPGGDSCKFMRTCRHVRWRYGGEPGLESAVEVCEVSSCLFEHPRSRSSAHGTYSCKKQSAGAWDCS